MKRRDANRPLLCVGSPSKYSAAFANQSVPFARQGFALMNLNEIPKYRMLKAGHYDGMFRGAGYVTSHQGWPPANAEPLNEAARRMMSYPFRTWSFRSSSPYIGEEKMIFCPGVPPGFEVRDIQPVPVKDVRPGMPRYDRNDGSDPVYWLGWPQPDWTALNEEAALVLAYYARFRDHPHLPTSPYCYYREGLRLPELSTHRKMTPEQRDFIDRAQAEAARFRAGGL